MGTSIIGIAPLGNTKADSAKASAKADGAKGIALANVFFKHLQDDFGKLRRFVTDVCALDAPGRKAFRVTLQSHLNMARKAVKSHEGTEEHAFWQRTLRTLGVRMSEMNALTSAIDKGWTPDKDMAYGQCIAAAVLLNRSEATGNTVQKGRPMLSVEDRVRKYIVTCIKQGKMRASDLPAAEAAIHSLGAPGALKAALKGEAEGSKPVKTPLKAATPKGSLTEERAKMPAIRATSATKAEVEAGRAKLQAHISAAANESIERAAASV